MFQANAGLIFPVLSIYFSVTKNGFDFLVESLIIIFRLCLCCSVLKLTV